MNRFRTNKTIERLNQMIDNAADGNPIEQGFDETRMSALETKLARYLAMNSSAKTQLTQEKTRVNELISNISHQTKTPVANLLLYAQLLDECNLPTQEKEYVHALMEQSKKLNFLIASLVKMSRLETGIIAAVRQKHRIQPMLEQVMNQMIPAAKAADILLTCKNSDTTAVFDPKWTAEALCNILDNAIKYTPSGGGVSVDVTPYEMFLKIDISDTGIGISEEETAKIFTRFYRSPAVSNQDGVGLGLCLAREIISVQGGYIRVDSTEGKGSVFSIFLPMDG